MQRTTRFPLEPRCLQAAAIRSQAPSPSTTSSLPAPQRPPAPARLEILYRNPRRCRSFISTGCCLRMRATPPRPIRAREPKLAHLARPSERPLALGLARMVRSNLKAVGLAIKCLPSIGKALQLARRGILSTIVAGTIM